MRFISDKKILYFKNLLNKSRIDIAMFVCSSSMHDVNIEYFTGFQQTRYLSFSCLLFSEELTLIVPHLEYDRALEEATADEIISLGDHENSLTKVLKKKIPKKCTVGIIERLFPFRIYRKFPKFKYVDIEDLILDVRGIKEKREIEKIEKACRITDQGVRFVEKNLSKDITERELALALEQEMIRRGADEMAFPTIVTSGERSAFIHPYPNISGEKISEGLGLVDFGVRVDGYSSDVTVPFSIGELSYNQKRIVGATIDAYEKSVDAIALNVPIWKVHELAENILKKNKFVLKHSLGHGLGLVLHDLPTISARPRDKKQLKEWKPVNFKEGMVFTIEPGVYVPGVGGCRLENDFLMTKKGAEVLTRSHFIEL